MKRWKLGALALGATIVVVTLAVSLVIAVGEARRKLDRQRLKLACHNAGVFLISYDFRHGKLPDYQIGESPCGESLGWQVAMASTLEPKGGPASDIMESLEGPQALDCAQFTQLVDAAAWQTATEDGRKQFIGVWPADAKMGDDRNRIVLIGSASFAAAWHLADDAEQLQALTNGQTVGEFSPQGIAATFADGVTWQLSAETPTERIRRHVAAEGTLPDRRESFGAYSEDAR